MASGRFSVPAVNRARIAASLAAVATCIGLGISGCNQAKNRTGPMTSDIQTRISQSIFPVLQKTVGEYAAFIDTGPISVEAFGVVAYLPHTGSGDMDPRIRRILMDQFDRDYVGFRSNNSERIDPEAILNSDQVAAVEVRGKIPPLARKDTHFDLDVVAIPNSQATSLANGLLFPSELKVIGLTLEGNDSRTLADGRGPVFISNLLDIAEKGSEYKLPPGAPRAQRIGRILGGGTCLEDRPARLQVYEPSEYMTRIIERTINARFPVGGQFKAAEAMDNSFIALHVPPEYAENPMDFVELVTHLYLTVEQPGFNEQQARQIIDALGQPGTPHRDLSLALEGLGRSILPDYIQPSYTSSDPEVRFWCARAGACLRDVSGFTVLQEFIKDPASPYRRPAIEALITASMGRDTTRATLALSSLLNSANTDDRILAYRALLAIHSRAVVSYDVGRKFAMDLVPSDGPPLIYVLQEQSPRIAFIGQMPVLPPGALYISKDNLLTVNVDEIAASGQSAGGPGPVLTAVSMGPASAMAGDIDAQTPRKEKENVTLYWRPPLGDRPVMLRTVSALPYLVARAGFAPNPRDLEANLRQPFIGASYQRITEMLAMMCADKIVNAQFVTEKPREIVTNPSDIALGGRQEGSTQEQHPPATAPAK